MLVKINSNVFVLASDVISIRKILEFASNDYNRWVAVVKSGDGVIHCIIPNDRVDPLVLEINEVLGK